MISQHSTATRGHLPHGAGWWGMVAGSALLTVTVVGAIGVWQVRDHKSAGTAGPEAAAPVSAAGTQPAPTTAVRQDAVVYLVSSPEQAAAVQARINAADALVAPFGVAPPADQLAVVTAADTDAFLRTMAEQDAIPAGLGLPSIRVVDLRPPATPLVTTDPGARELDALTAANVGVLSTP